MQTLLAIGAALLVTCSLLAEVQPLPASRGGQDLIGKPMPDLHFHWINHDEKADADKPAVTLYRWWTESCPFCEATLPAVETLRKKYESKGLRVVAVYHPKPPRAVADEKVTAAAEQRGYRGAVAVDQDWSQLKKAWLSTGDRTATSVSFLVDRKGVIRFVHPGVMYFPKDQREDSEANRDYELLDRAIEAVLQEK
jgi:thiol-disulfide isomerase/thioredoxin